VFVCLFHHQSQIEIGEHFNIILARSFNAFDREHPSQQYLFPRASASASTSASAHNTTQHIPFQTSHPINQSINQSINQFHNNPSTLGSFNPSSTFSCLSCTNFVFCCRLVTCLSTVLHPMDIWMWCNI
jgi:hypothetical protein